MADQAVPSPVPKSLVCSVCGLEWGKHKKKQHNLMECVELLKAELASRPVMNWGFPNTVSTGYYQLGGMTN